MVDEIYCRKTDHLTGCTLLFAVELLIGAAIWLCHHFHLFGGAR
jgi:hypothetical protein